MNMVSVLSNFIETTLSKNFEIRVFYSDIGLSLLMGNSTEFTEDYSQVRSVEASLLLANEVCERLFFLDFVYLGQVTLNCDLFFQHIVALFVHNPGTLVPVLLKLNQLCLFQNCLLFVVADNSLDFTLVIGKSCFLQLCVLLIFYNCCDECSVFLVAHSIAPGSKTKFYSAHMVPVKPFGHCLPTSCMQNLFQSVNNSCDCTQFLSLVIENFSKTRHYHNVPSLRISDLNFTFVSIEQNPSYHCSPLTSSIELQELLLQGVDPVLVPHNVGFDSTPHPQLRTDVHSLSIFLDLFVPKLLLLDFIAFASEFMQGKSFMTLNSFGHYFVGPLGLFSVDCGAALPL